MYVYKSSLSLEFVYLLFFFPFLCQYLKRMCFHQYLCKRIGFTVFFLPKTVDIRSPKKVISVHFLHS